MAKQLKWWQYFQIEVGGRWQLFPSGSMTWKEWVLSPYVTVVYPNKKLIKPRAVLPDEMIFGGIKSRGKHDWYSLIHWYAAGVRLFGLDVGIAVFIRTKESVAKLTGKLNG